MRKTFFVIPLVLLLSAFLAARTAGAGLFDTFGEGAYQHDMDIARLNDLKEIGGYIEEYKEKTGKYPLMGEIDIPVHADIATKEQQEIIRQSGGPPYKHAVVSANDFISELERGLGRKIVMPFDPQRAPSGRQNFYSYMTAGDRYFFAVHLYRAFPFAQKIGDNWYKVEISNSPQPDRPIWAYKTLISDQDFQKALSEPLNKPGYVEQLREKLRKEVGF